MRRINMRKIILSTKEDLNIYMNPTRQEILRILTLNSDPMTPKMLSDRLGISASGVQHHIKKLLGLNLIELDHIEVINGINAKLYKASDVTVQIGLESDDGTSHQRKAIMQASISGVYDRFNSHLEEVVSKNPIRTDEFAAHGDILTGIVHLSENDSAELMSIIRDYIDDHSTPSKEKSPWEYALILYDTRYRSIDR
jgi:DNA-binding transcriptional ArsR family regulator